MKSFRLKLVRIGNEYDNIYTQMSINRFAVNSSHIYDITKVSHLSDGLMLKEDKDKLDGLIASEGGTNVSVTVVSPSSEELEKEFADIKTQLIEQRDLYNRYESFINSPGQPDGLATLDSTGKLSASQLPAFKTVNGESVIGDGNIEIRPGTDVDFTPVNTSINNLSTYINENYARKSEISSFATTSYVDTAVAGVDVTEQLKDYAKKTDIPAAYDDTQIKTDIADLKKINHDDYATKTFVSQEIAKIPTFDDAEIRSDISALQSIDHSRYLTEHQTLKTVNSKSLVGSGNYSLVDFSDNIISDSAESGIQFKDKLSFGTTNVASMTYSDASQIFVFDKEISAPNFVESYILTRAEYDALTEKKENVIYYIKG